MHRLTYPQLDVGGICSLLRMQGGALYLFEDCIRLIVSMCSCSSEAWTCRVKSFRVLSAIVPLVEGHWARAEDKDSANGSTELPR